MKRIVVCCSGKGSDVVNLEYWIKFGLLKGVKLSALVTDRSCMAEKVAKGLGLKVVRVSKETMLEDFRKLKPNLVVLSGFMSIIPENITKEFKIINIHPSLLPDLAGKDPQKQALVKCREKTGVTIHWVDGGVDTGSIILQEEHPIFDWDTLDTLSLRLQILGSNLLLHVLQIVVKTVAL